MIYHWALDIAAIFVVLAVAVPLLIMRRRPPRRPFIMPPLWDRAALWDTGVHLAPAADPRRRGRIGRHRR